MALEEPHLSRLAEWFGAGTPVVIVRVAAVRGSAPRNEDALMGVTMAEAAGTIGGGQLEWLAMAHAREILSGKGEAGEREVPLGPEIGQCCGGRVRLSFDRLGAALLEALRTQTLEAAQNLPQVLIFGAGHTGKALAAALAPLPVRNLLVDTREDAFAAYCAPVETVLTPLPEVAVRSAPPGSAFVAMTHEHSLDFLITAEALKRGDAAYCGMIGSATKRAVFLNWLEDNGYGRSLGDRLVCPIGGSAVKDKRPAVIAALTAAEIIAALHMARVRSVEL